MDVGRRVAGERTRRLGGAGVEPLARPPQRPDAELTDEAAPAPRTPGEARAGRQRAQEIRLGLGRGIAIDLDRVVVEGGDLVLAHSGGGEPERNVDVAQTL